MIGNGIPKARRKYHYRLSCATKKDRTNSNSFLSSSGSISPIAFFSIVWCIAGYSLATTPATPWISRIKIRIGITQVK